MESNFDKVSPTSTGWVLKSVSNFTADEISHVVSAVVRKDRFDFNDLRVTLDDGRIIDYHVHSSVETNEGFKPDLSKVKILTYSRYGTSDIIRLQF